jgi:citrate synthase
MINVDCTMQSTADLNAREAAALLGVKLQTLYAYASRGLVRRVGTGKKRRYLREDIDRLRQRASARSGHGPVAAAALSFGEPVLDTLITFIDQRGPSYRGRAAVELAQAQTRFEAVAELLWTGELPKAAPIWPALGAAAKSRSVPVTLEDLLFALPAFARAAPERHLLTSEAELALARRLIRGLAQLIAGRARASHSAAHVSNLLANRCRGVESRLSVAALDVALVLVADHELNASSFVARIAASTGANLLVCLQAALATLSGPRHGGACDRVDALLDEASSLRDARRVIELRARRGDTMPGFGHALYPAGDPRARLLLERVSLLAKSSPAAQRRTEPALALERAMRRQGLPATVDFGLVALTRALGMPAGSAALLFALGRCAGWVAQVLEQRGSAAVLRPRARYLGA